MPKEQGEKLVASNKRARHDYAIEKTYEAGLVLTGTEVKALRMGRASLVDGYASIDRGEAWLEGVHIAPYEFANGVGAHDPARRRKLLLHRREIERITARLQTERLTLVPLSLYFKDGRAKLELGIGRGRKNYDKRQVVAQRDAARDVDRSLAAARRR